MPSARNIGAAVVGWIAMTALVFGLMSALWTILGPDGAFQPEAWDVSSGWIVGSIAVGLAAAVAGGATCAKISDGPAGLRILVGIVILTGILSAFLQMTESGTAPGPRPVDVDMAAAMTTARQPMWMAFVNPVLGVVGAVFGARLVGRRG